MELVSFFSKLREVQKSAGLLQQSNCIIEPCSFVVSHEPRDRYMSNDWLQIFFYCTWKLKVYFGYNIACCIAYIFPSDRDINFIKKNYSKGMLSSSLWVFSVRECSCLATHALQKKFFFCLCAATTNWLTLAERDELNHEIILCGLELKKYWKPTRWDEGII